MTLITEITADEARNITELIEQADKLARDLLSIQGGDDPDEALVGAMRVLLRAANVADEYTGDCIHPSIVLGLLINQFGVESVRGWTRDFARRLRRRR